MSSTLARAAVVLACLGLFACGEETTPPGGGGTGGGIGGTGGSGGTGGTEVPDGLCGNGLQEGEEECDDANQDNTDGCLDTCRKATCGDGFIREWGDPKDLEECDGGVANSNTEPNACRENCKFAHCGDGVIDDGEVCDDGEANSATEPGACRPAGTPNGFACKPGGCGDGVLDPGEACDDGNDDDDDSCRNNCSVPRCGDGILDAGELCDDGNDFDNDACTNACKPAACGDGIIGPGELCDDGNSISTDNCVWPACVPNVCGDGIPNDNNTVEVCEPALDRNCRADCTMPGQNDGVLDFNEECDDGNTDPTDACHNGKWATCGDGAVRAGVEECDPLDLTPGAPLCRSGRGSRLDCTIPRLNDGVLDPELGEECDDGNQSPYDGCLPTGKLPLCGDGFKNGTEECDASDPNNTIANCRPNCTIAPTCGDGVRHPTEEACDDNNTVSGDGCSGTDATTSCQIETGFTCSGSPSVCRAICGDGKVLGTEVCDDGNTANNDGCNSTCTALTNGWTCTGGSPTTPSVCTAVCGDGIVIAGREACDDNNSNNNDACVMCQNTTLPFVFTDFTTANVEATMRSLVKVKVQLTPAIVANFDPAARLRYKITVTKGTAPAAGVYAYLKKASDGTDHTTWTDEVFTDGNGVAWFGPAAGATASQLGIDGAHGAETPFSVVFPTDGSHKVKLELINVSASDVLVGQGEHTFNVGARKLNVTFNGFSGFLEGVPSTTTLTASLATSVTGNLHWEAIVTRDDGSGNQVGVPGVDANGVLTGADGRAVLPEFAATTLHGTPKTVQFPMMVPDAGTYLLRLELRNASNALVGFASTAMVVTYDRVVFTDVDFDGVDDTGFAAGIRNVGAFTAELDGRYASGTPTNGKWQITVTRGASPAADVAVFYAVGADDPANHNTWSGSATTGPDGKADVGGLFALDTLKVTDGVPNAWSLRFPTTGLHTVRFDLVQENGTVVDGHAVDVNVAAPLTVTFRDYDLLWAGVRGETRIIASLHRSFDANTPVQLKFTLTDGSSAVVAGHKAYFPLSTDGSDPTTWTQFVETLADGTVLFPAAPVAPVDTNLQRPGGHTWRFGPEFTTAGPYSLKVDLVLGSDTGSVVGTATHNFTVAAP